MKRFVIYLLIFILGLIACEIRYDSLFEYLNEEYIYVSISKGDDKNSGDFFEPMQTIEAGINKAISTKKNRVKIARGTYTPALGLDSSGDGILITNSNIELSGGWNEDFNNQDEDTVLDGQDKLYHVIAVVNVSNVTIDNFKITGGLANGVGANGIGAGVLFSNVENSEIKDVVIYSNVADLKGGGVYLMDSNNNKINGIIKNNNSNSGGGGVFMLNSSYNILNCQINNNQSGAALTGTNVGGGGIAILDSDYNKIYGSVFSNESQAGGGIFLYRANDTEMYVDIYANFSTVSNYLFGSGGGVKLIESNYCIISGCKIYSNNSYNSSAYGGGVFLYKSSNNTINNCAINNNMSNSMGGGIALYTNSGGTVNNNNITNCVINNNTANSNGGGIFINNVSGTINNTGIRNCDINNNWSGMNGAGIYVQLTVNTQITNCIVKDNNAPNTRCGGIYVYEGGGHIIKDCTIISNKQSKSAIGLRNLTSAATITLDNNIIGCGDNPSDYGIYEDFGSGVINHTLINNKFHASTMQYLYHDSGGFDITSANYTTTGTELNGAGNDIGASSSVGNMP